MMATGSPGASRKRKNTNTATTTMTGMVAMSRRRINTVMCSPAQLLPSRCFCPCGARRAVTREADKAQPAARPQATLSLCNVPKHDEAGVGHDTVQPVGAVGEHGVPLPERNVDHLVHGTRLQLARDLGLLLVLLGKPV